MICFWWDQGRAAVDLPHTSYEATHHPNKTTQGGDRNSPKDVGDKPFVAMHVRGESSKDVIDNNEKAIVYLLHQDMLYCWKKDHVKV